MRVCWQPNIAKPHLTIFRQSLQPPFPTDGNIPYDNQQWTIVVMIEIWILTDRGWNEAQVLKVYACAQLQEPVFDIDESKVLFLYRLA
jgi:hypothetical protein